MTSTDAGRSRRSSTREIEAGAPPGAVVVHDIPLLAETGQAASFDAVVVVDVPVETQVERMTGLRGMTEADARARIAAQATREERLAVATYVVDNTGSLDDLRTRVAQVYADLVGDQRVRRAGSEPSGTGD